MSPRAIAALATSALFLLAACPSPPPKDTKYPPLPEGCEVRVFPEAPSVQTDNIGPVMATCDESVSDADCVRTLKDQVCKLGGDVVWGVDPVPSKVAGKKKLAGRAAHTKVAGK